MGHFSSQLCMDIPELSVPSHLETESNIRSLVIYLKEEAHVRENQPHFHHRRMLPLLKNKTMKSSEKSVKGKG